MRGRIRRRGRFRFLARRSGRRREGERFGSLELERTRHDRGRGHHSAVEAGRAGRERLLSANPLWAMPIKQFSVTRDRPIFLPSRRPPAPPASAVTVAKAIVPPKPKEPEQPQLSLVGTISGDDAKFGIFIDQSTKAVLRLQVGEDFQGWKLQSVQGREAAFQKNQLSFVVALPQPGLSQPSIAVREEARSPEDGKLLPVNARPRNR